MLNQLIQKKTTKIISEINTTVLDGIHQWPLRIDPNLYLEIFTCLCLVKHLLDGSQLKVQEGGELLFFLS